ncbi:hypothetical protein S83_058405 [Arachis hypogaea]
MLCSCCGSLRFTSFVTEFSDFFTAVRDRAFEFVLEGSFEWMRQLHGGLLGRRVSFMVDCGGALVSDLSQTNAWTAFIIKIMNNLNP